MEKRLEKKVISYKTLLQDSYSLEQMCGGSPIFPSGEKTENMLMNLFMPLCLRVGSGRKGINLTLSYILHLL